jgi:hypothetical protein
MKRALVRRLAMIPAAVAASIGGAAHAAIDTAVSTELATAKTDVLALGALVFAIFVSIALYKWFKRAL